MYLQIRDNRKIGLVAILFMIASMLLAALLFLTNIACATTPTAALFPALWTGLSAAVAIHIVLTAIHYVHERLWLKIKWGKQ